MQKKYIFYYLIVISFNFILSNEADHLVLSKVCIAPNKAQMVEIFNPTDSDINLNPEGDGSYYLTDGAQPSQNKYYYNLPSNQDYWSENNSDFFIEFPENTIISSQSSLTISLHDNIIYNDFYGENPDISLYDIAGDGSFYNFEAISILSSDESLMLFYWDGNAQSLVEDVDYLLWGSNTYSIDKTNISNYLPDTSLENQVYLETSGEYYLYSRKSNTENGENINGNGITGHDETSEDFLSSWEIVLSPGIVFGCTTDTATNYNQAANADDGSCFTSTHTIEQIVTSDPNSIGSGYQATIAGLVKSFDDIRPSGGPQVIVLEDENGFRIDAVIWDWDVLSSSIGYMFDVYDPSIYSVGALGTVGVYNNSFQFEISSENNIFLYREYHPEGNLVEDETIIQAEIVTAPYVIIPSLGERLDFSYSFPSNSRVIVRIIDLNGIFITSIVDRYYETGGVVERYEDTSDWDGRNHLGQIVNPGTYLIQVEASDFQTGRTTTDVAPIVVGVNH